MSFPDGRTMYSGHSPQYYQVSGMPGGRLSENFGEFSMTRPIHEEQMRLEEEEMAPPMRAREPLPMRDERFYASSEATNSWNANTAAALPPPSTHFVTEDAGEYMDNPEDSYYVDFSPPIGYWDPASDFATQEYAIQKMVENKRNTFDISSHMEYKLSDGAKTEWDLASEWGDDAIDRPYDYSGSPFQGGERLISRIWLMDASHNGMVSQTLHFSMPNSLTKEEMFKPIIPVLVRTEDGPTHVVLRPGEKLQRPVLLWYKQQEEKRSPILRKFAHKTDSDLREELKENHNPREAGHVKNLMYNSVLLRYMEDRIKMGKMENCLTPVESEGYVKVPIRDAESAIDSWKREQSADLSVKDLYNMTVRPNRAVRSAPGTKAYHEDAFQDQAEIMSHLNEFSLGDKTEEKSFLSKVIREKPITVYWNIRVELTPDTRRSATRY